MSLQYDPASRPHIQADHIDGPLLFLRDGRLHWLTWRERLQLWLGRTDASKLERKWWAAAPKGGA